MGRDHLRAAGPPVTYTGAVPAQANALDKLTAFGAAQVITDKPRDQWVFKRDARVHVPWPRALHTVDGIPYLRPELALLHKPISTGPRTERTWPRPSSTRTAGPG